MASMRKVYGFFSSSRLALALLLAILVSCLLGVTVVRGEQAWRLIFSTTWFNALLVLLVVNVTVSFIGRMRGRKLTLVNLGMLLFHLTFLVIFIGVSYNSLYYFHGKLRLTEGEVLPNSDLSSFDAIDHGRFFDKSLLSGQTGLIRMHRDFKVNGEDKMVAYEIEVGESGSKAHDIIYITKNLDHDGFKYIPDKEGYTVLVVLYDEAGREIYGGFIPLQSFWMEKDKTYLYTTGTKEYGPGSLPFPYPPASPLLDLQVVYHPSKAEERGGEATFTVWPIQSHDEKDAKDEQKPVAEGRARVGEQFPVSGFSLSVKEVRYWVGMNVKYDPGHPIVLSSLWVGLAGTVLVFVGRLRQRRARRRAAAEQDIPDSRS